MKIKLLKFIAIGIYLLSDLLFYNLYGKGTDAYIKITNIAKVFALNYSITNKWISSNIIVAEIRGIIEVSSNTNIQYGVIGTTNKFWYSITNRGNITETNLYIKLTNWTTNTNVTAGTWRIGLLNESSKIIFITNSQNFSSATYKVTNKIISDSYYKFAVFLVPSTNCSPLCWVSIDMEAYLKPATNISYYTAGGEYYGGWTNLKRSCRVEMASPLISLIKEITRLTNVITGGSQVMPGCEIWYRIYFTNSGSAAGKNLQIIDTLPPKYIMLTNYFIFSNFATNFGSPKFSADNGKSWNYNFSGWNTNVTHIKFSATNKAINPGDKGIIIYKIKIK